ncbi:hypothetical protein KFK09_011652 [Dendrobium nobile]|uniref:Uncharacterized protein n=1 Tax=Dendrobium nobile TaxID=94219 RepID=A0A8T3BF63_DENNO|nr:hypothetical protein KFK09_011652 [Dendrobium nobile]
MARVKHVGKLTQVPCLLFYFHLGKINNMLYFLQLFIFCHNFYVTFSICCSSNA